MVTAARKKVTQKTIPIVELKRKNYAMPEKWRPKFDALIPAPGHAFNFWRALAYEMQLDASSIIGDEVKPYTFSALPIGHTKHWCYPIPLKCAKPVAQDQDQFERKPH